MPFLMVRLDDPADCRRALNQLRARIQAAAARSAPVERCQPPAMAGWDGGPGRTAVARLPLGQKLRRIRHRGLWPHLVQIAEASPEPRSLMEWDEALSLPANKMRSLKAIMAKLEHRFAIRFLQPAPDAGVDAAGNPRYVMVPRVRQVIRRLATQPGDAAI